MSTIVTTIDPERQMLGEVEMVGRELWEEIHRRASSGASIRAIARELDLDRKTVRRCLRQTAWTPYERAARSDTPLATHADYLRRRAADVGYSAQVLFQELRRRQYAGSYETVKRFVACSATRSWQRRSSTDCCTIATSSRPLATATGSKSPHATTRPARHRRCHGNSARRDVASRRSAPSGHVATTTTTQKWWGVLFCLPFPHPASVGVCVSGGDSGLVQPVCLGLGAVGDARRPVLPGRARTGVVRWPTGHLQYGQCRVRQFTGAAFTSLLRTAGVRISMDGRGRALDNVFVERLWRSVKYEEIHLKAYVSVPDARAGLTHYFGFYNHERPHQALAYRTPAEVYGRVGAMTPIGSGSGC